MCSSLSASSRSSLKHLKKLIDSGANVNFSKTDGTTPLINAAMSKWSNGVKLLLDNGAKINHKNWEGNNALMNMLDYNLFYDDDVDSKIYDIVVIFIEHGVNLMVKNKNGKTVFDININVEKYIEENYPDMYSEYAILKDSEKYNL